MFRFSGWIVGAALMTLASGTSLMGGNEGNADKGTGILLVAFGTSYDEGRVAFDVFEKAVKARYPEARLAWGFTSGKVRAILAKRGVKTLSPDEAIVELAKSGVKRIVVQSLHIFEGEEFEEVCACVFRFKGTPEGKGIELSVGKPMLSNGADLDRFIASCGSLIPEGRSKDDAVVFFGHGNAKGVGDFVYIAANAELNKADKLVFVTTVEGRPDFAQTVKELKAAGAKKAYLIPLMFVAGDHARNDMAGDEDGSLKGILKKEGVEGVPVLKGLGQSECAINIFLSHIDDAFKGFDKKTEGHGK